MEKKEAARILFNDGWTQTRISKALRVTEKTISSWKRSGKWGEKRTEAVVARETSEEGLWELIAYQVDTLKKMKEQYLTEQKPKLIERGDIDALQKMFTAVKGRQHTWTSYVIALREFAEYMEKVDFSLAKKMVEHADEFLNTKRKEL